MINICYFNAQVRDELDGAAAYIEKAINLKGAHPSWASYFARMSSGELEHAATLLQIFSEQYREEREGMSEDGAKILDDVYKTMNDMYADGVATVKQKQSLYNEM